MVSSIALRKNNDVLIPVLLELKEIETEEHLINRIDDIIAKRVGY